MWRRASNGKFETFSIWLKERSITSYWSWRRAKFSIDGAWRPRRKEKKRLEEKDRRERVNEVRLCWNTYLLKKPHDLHMDSKNLELSIKRVKEG